MISIQHTGCKERRTSSQLSWEVPVCSAQCTAWRSVEIRTPVLFLWSWGPSSIPGGRPRALRASCRYPHSCPFTSTTLPSRQRGSSNSRRGGPLLKCMFLRGTSDSLELPGRAKGYEITNENVRRTARERESGSEIDNFWIKVNEEITEQKASKKRRAADVFLLREALIIGPPDLVRGGPEGEAPFSCPDPHCAEWSAKARAPRTTTKRLVQASEREHGGRGKGHEWGDCGEIEADGDPRLKQRSPEVMKFYFILHRQFYSMHWTHFLILAASVVCGHQELLCASACCLLTTQAHMCKTPVTFKPNVPLLLHDHWVIKDQTRRTKHAELYRQTLSSILPRSEQPGGVNSTEQNTPGQSCC